MARVRSHRRASDTPAACRGLLCAFCLALAGAAAAELPSGTELDCSAAGYDVLVTNAATETLDAGQAVVWEVRFVRKSGVFEIESPLEPGENALISGALGSDYLGTPQPCTAVVQ